MPLFLRIAIAKISMDDLTPIIAAIKAGDRHTARKLLRPLLKHPTADRLYLAALLAKPATAEDYLLQALELQPDHQPAQRQLTKLRRAAAAAEPEFIATVTEADQPPLDLLTDVAPRLTTIPRGVTEVDLPPLKQPQTRRPRSVWTYIGCGSIVTLSVTISYVVLLLLGSSLPGQMRSFIARYDERVIEPAGTLVYATPVTTFEGTPLYAHPFLEREIDATPVTEIDGIPVYNRPDAVTIVQPVVIHTLQLNNPLSDVLEPGYAHEYVFSARAGDEIAIAIQFFSPFAQRVGRNVRLFDAQGDTDEADCQRDTILSGDTGVAFICQIDVSGEWKLRLFGREGESSGAYVVAYERF